MKKLSGLVAFAAILCLSGASLAANLSNAIGSTCDGEGTWHFVNNQTGGAGAGTLTADFGLAGICQVDASAVLKSVQHFYCFTSGEATLTGASTNLPGKLVLSDFDCGGKCVPDEKGEICGDGIDNDCDDKIDEDCGCVPTEEICDGVDNDCDEKIDEDLICK